MVRDLTQEIAETDDFLPFWYRGTRDVFLSAGAAGHAMSFIGWRSNQPIFSIWLIIDNYSKER